jgi:hypothetical protein
MVPLVGYKEIDWLILANGYEFMVNQSMVTYKTSIVSCYSASYYLTGLLDTRPWIKAETKSKEGSKVLFTYRPRTGSSLHQDEALFLIVFPKRIGIYSVSTHVIHLLLLFVITY